MPSLHPTTSTVLDRVHAQSIPIISFYDTYFAFWRVHNLIVEIILFQNGLKLLYELGLQTADSPNTLSPILHQLLYCSLILPTLLLTCSLILQTSTNTWTSSTTLLFVDTLILWTLLRTWYLIFNYHPNIINYSVLITPNLHKAQVRKKVMSMAWWAPLHSQVQIAMISSKTSTKFWWIAGQCIKTHKKNEHTFKHGCHWSWTNGL